MLLAWCSVEGSRNGVFLRVLCSLGWKDRRPRLADFDAFPECSIQCR